MALAGAQRVLGAACARGRRRTRRPSGGSSATSGSGQACDASWSRRARGRRRPARLPRAAVPAASARRFAAALALRRGRGGSIVDVRRDDGLLAQHALGSSIRRLVAVQAWRRCAARRPGPPGHRHERPPVAVELPEGARGRCRGTSRAARARSGTPGPSGGSAGERRPPRAGRAAPRSAGARAASRRCAGAPSMSALTNSSGTPTTIRNTCSACTRSSAGSVGQRRAARHRAADREQRRDQQREAGAGGPEADRETHEQRHQERQGRVGPSGQERVRRAGSR